jgi:hypothetical protein
MKPIYFSASIRGKLGELASEAFQQGNIQAACEMADKIRERIPGINLYVPHEDKLVNRLYFKGCLSGSDIVETECDMIREGEYAGVIVAGDYHEGTGVGLEIKAADSIHLPVIFIENVMEQELEYLSIKMHEEELMEEFDCN